MGLPVSNLLLQSLPPELNAALSKHLEPVTLPLKTVLFEEDARPRYVHLMTSGIASIVTMMEGGEAVEVGLTGREGFPEKLHVLGPQAGPSRCFVQVPGTALRMEFGRFQAAFLETPTLLTAALKFVQHEGLVLAQLAACNRLHEVEARLARWLLMVQDRVGEPQMTLTQEFLGFMLGVRRSSVNLAANNLQRAGVITYSRGRIHVENRESLESVACECYPIISRLYQNLYK